MARKGWWIRSSAVVTYSVSVSYQIDRSEISLLNYFGKIKTSCLDLIFFFFFCQKALWDKMQNFRGRGAITGAIYLWTSGVDLICS